MQAWKTVIGAALAIVQIAVVSMPAPASQGVSSPVAQLHAAHAHASSEGAPCPFHAKPAPKPPRYTALCPCGCGQDQPARAEDHRLDEGALPEREISERGSRCVDPPALAAGSSPERARGIDHVPISLLS